MDRAQAVEPVRSSNFAVKAKIRRAIEAEGIPHTFVSSNSFAGYSLAILLQPTATAPPRDKVTIPGDGNTKGMYQILYASMNPYDYLFIYLFFSEFVE